MGIKQKKKEVGPISSRRLMLYKSIKAIQPFHPLKSGNVASWQLSGKQLLALRLSVLRARPARESSSSGATIVNKAVLKKACKHLRLANKVARELQKDVEHTEKIRLAHKYARRFSLSDLEDSVNIIRTAVHYREKLKADRLRSTKLKKFKAIMGDRSKKKLKLKTGRSVRAVKRLVNQLLRASRKRELLKRKRLEYSFRAIKRIFRVYSANIRRAGGDNDEAKMRRTETIVTAFETANFFVMEALFAVTRDDNVALVYSTKKSVESRIQRITNISNVKNNCGKFLTKEAALFTSVSLMVYLTLTFRQLIRELSKKPPRAAKSTVKKKKPVDTIGKLKALLGENLKSRRFIAGFLKLFLTRNTMLNLK